MIDKIFDKDIGISTKTSYIKKLISGNTNEDVILRYIEMYPDNLNYEENILLKTSIKYKNKNIFKKLISLDNININASSGKPLIFAVEYQDEYIVKKILNHKNINLEERNFKAFRIAQEYFSKDSDIIKLFKEKLDNYIINPLNAKLLMLCFLQHKMYDYFVEFHKKHNVDINSDNGTLFRTACKLSIKINEYDSFIDYMLSLEDINPNLKEGEALVTMVDNNRLDIIQKFYDSGKFNFNIRNNKIVRDAISQNKKEIFDFFIDVAKVKPIEHDNAALVKALNKSIPDYAIKLLKDQDIRRSLKNILKKGCVINNNNIHREVYKIINLDNF